MQKNGKGKLKTRYTWSTIRDQTKGELTLCKPNEGKNSISLKIFFREIEGEGEETDYIKKKKGWDLKIYRWRLGPSPADSNESVSMELLGAWDRALDELGDIV